MPDASYRFGPFYVDRTGYRVLRDDDPLTLTPKLLDLLFHLLDHSGTLVTKEELLDALWPGANVTDNALAQAMSELRQALGDDAGARSSSRRWRAAGTALSPRSRRCRPDHLTRGRLPVPPKPDITHRPTIERSPSWIS
jgi:DNA-binding response OmpR family regulator